MLMDDGGVELLNYHSVMGWSDIEPGHLLSSGRLPEMTDIVSFVQKPVFDVFEGDTIGGYITIFAVDKDGKEHEIQECARSFPSLYHFNPSGDGSTEEHVLTIWPDWKIEYRNGWHESERNEDYFGRIRPLKMDYENETYEYQYEMLTHTQYLSVEEDPVTKNVFSTVDVIRDIGVYAAPSFRTRTAATASKISGSGTKTTAASATDASAVRTDSTSNGPSR